MKFLNLTAVLFLGSLTFAQTAPPTDPTKPTTTTATDDSSTSTDVFLMFGSDFDRPGLVPRANYNVGIGHTFDFISKSAFGKIFGDEPTIAYTYENGGPSGFWHGPVSTSTETFGLMKNFGIPYIANWEAGTIGYTKKVTMYTWPQFGITSIKGVQSGVQSGVQNRMYSGFSLGAIIHLTKSQSIWIQESYNKVVTVPWYTTTSIGYGFSF
jgi:hypothetical protein